MATHSSILAWRIPWTEEPGGLLSMGSQESDTTQQLNKNNKVVLSPFSSLLQPCPGSQDTLTVSLSVKANITLFTETGVYLQKQSQSFIYILCLTAFALQWEELSSCNRLYDPQNLNYLATLQKKGANLQSMSISLVLKNALVSKAYQYVWETQNTHEQ